MSDDLPGWITECFSPARLEPYLRAAKGDAQGAMRLYWWNAKIAEAFSFPLGHLEVAVRNALHSRLRERYERADWWAAAPLTESSLWRVEQARLKFARRGGRQPSADDVVAQLSFGFWVALVSRSYDRPLWVPALHRAFPHYAGRRDTLHRGLQTMRLLRNRIGHQEPIHHRDLVADHATIYRLLGYLSPDLADGVRLHDRVPAVLQERPR